MSTHRHGDRRAREQASPQGGRASSVGSGRPGQPRRSARLAPLRAGAPQEQSRLSSDHSELGSGGGGGDDEPEENIGADVQEKKTWDPGGRGEERTSAGTAPEAPPPPSAGATTQTEGRTRTSSSREGPETGHVSSGESSGHASSDPPPPQPVEAGGSDGEEETRAEGEEGEGGEEEEETTEASRPVSERARGRRRGGGRPAGRAEFPRRPKSAFMCYLSEFRQRYSVPKARVADVAKAAGEEWRTLTAEEREKYEEMSAQSKEAYRAERDRMYPPKKKEGPRRPQGAFFHFLTDFRESWHREHPQEQERLPMKVISQRASEKWKSLTDAERAPYHASADKDKEVYRSWKRTHGGSVVEGGEGVEEEEEEEGGPQAEEVATRPRDQGIQMGFPTAGEEYEAVGEEEGGTSIAPPVFPPAGAPPAAAPRGFGGPAAAEAIGGPLRERKERKRRRRPYEELETEEEEQKEEQELPATSLSEGMARQPVSAGAIRGQTGGRGARRVRGVSRRGSGRLRPFSAPPTGLPPLPPSRSSPPPQPQPQSMMVEHPPMAVTTTYPFDLTQHFFVTLPFSPSLTGVPFVTTPPAMAALTLPQSTATAPYALPPAPAMHYVQAPPYAQPQAAAAPGPTAPPPTPQEQQQQQRQQREAVAAALQVPPSVVARLQQELESHLVSLNQLLTATPAQAVPLQAAAVDSEAAGALLALAGLSATPAGQQPSAATPGQQQQPPQPQEHLPAAGPPSSLSALEMAQQQLRAVQDLQSMLAAQVAALQATPSAPAEAPVALALPPSFAQQTTTAPPPAQPTIYQTSSMPVLTPAPPPQVLVTAPLMGHLLPFGHAAGVPQPATQPVSEPSPQEIAFAPAVVVAAAAATTTGQPSLQAPVALPQSLPQLALQLQQLQQQQQQQVLPSSPISQQEQWQFLQSILAQGASPTAAVGGPSISFQAPSIPHGEPEASATVPAPSPQLYIPLVLAPASAGTEITAQQTALEQAAVLQIPLPPEALAGGGPLAQIPQLFGQLQGVQAPAPAESQATRPEPSEHGQEAQGNPAGTGLSSGEADQRNDQHSNNENEDDRSAAGDGDRHRTESRQTDRPSSDSH